MALVRPARVASGVAAAVLVTGAAATGMSAASESRPSAGRQTMYAPPTALVQYGHIKSVARKGSRYELRFDPALWLGGETANRAAVEDNVIPPGETVPNDYYIRDESHRLLTYRVPAGAHVSVLTQGPRSTTITVAELAQIVRGKNPRHRRLYDSGNYLGYWIRVTADTVRALDQQYQP